MSQCSEQSGKVCECDWRHVSDSLPTLRICVGLYWQVSLCLCLELHSSTYCLSQFRARTPLLGICSIYELRACLS